MTHFLDPERTRRILLQAMEEVLGNEGLHSVLTNAGEEVPAPFVSRVLEALEGVYGPQAGRGLALRVGRASFSYGLREYGAALGLTGPGFRLLPLHSKLRTFGKALSGLVNERGAKRLQLEEQEDRLLIHLLDCPVCDGRHASQPVCQWATGLAEESLYWLSGGKMFHVEETACAARGDEACTLQIDKAPLS